jgi:hypothetical protein
MRLLALLVPISLGACAPASGDFPVDDPLMTDAADLGVEDPLMNDVEIVEAVQEAPKPRRPEPTITYFPQTFYEPSLQCDDRFGGLQPVLSIVEKSWYPEQLDAAGEPSLYLVSQANRPRGQESLRFTWLPTFHHPVVVRIETLDDGEQKLIATRLSGAGGYDPGEVKDRIERMLTPAESRRLEKMLNQTRIFGLPPTLCADGGADGAQWIFEAADVGGYHFVNRWSPRKGEARKMGLFLLSLTGWTFETVY